MTKCLNILSHGFMVGSFFQNKFWIEFDTESGSILKRPNWELSRNSHVIKTHKYSKDRVIKWVGLERRNVARLPSLPCYSGWKIKQGRWELHIEYAVPCKNIRIHDDTQKTELQEKFCGGLSNQRRIDDRQCVQQLWHNILNRQIKDGVTGSEWEHSRSVVGSYGLPRYATI